MTVAEGEIGLEAGDHIFGLDGDTILDADGCPIADNDARSHAAAIREAIDRSGAEQVRELLE